MHLALPLVAVAALIGACRGPDFVSGGGGPAGAGGPGGGPAGGGPAGAGGPGGAEPTGPFDVAVSLIDSQGDVVPSVPLLVSDPDGAELELVDTDITGVITVSVPKNGRVSVFHDDGSLKRAFSAEVVANMPTVVFRLPTPAPTNANATPVISAACFTSCGETNELSISCRAPFLVADQNTPYDQAAANYQGCAGSSHYDAFMIGYDPQNRAIAASTDDIIIPTASPTLPNMMPIGSGQRSSLSMKIDGLLVGYEATRSVRVPYLNRPGYSFSRTSDLDESSFAFSLVNAFVPRARAGFAVLLSEKQIIARQVVLEPYVPDAVDLNFDVGSLAIPKVPTSPDLSTPGQPVASFELGQGPPGDAIQLKVYGGTTIVWLLSMPHAESRELRLPALPESLNEYAITGVGDMDVIHVDVDSAAGYAAWAAEPVIDRFGDESSLSDVTVSWSTL